MPRPTALIIGATSDVGLALARVYAAAGYDLVLAARDANALAADVREINRHYEVTGIARSFDLLDIPGHQAFLKTLPAVPDVAICAAGFYGDPAEALREPAHAEIIMRTNYIAPALLIEALAHQMEARGSGTLVGLSSVSGDRGRAKNYMYGSAKAGFTAFLSGLRNRLARKGVRVITAKPGYIRTRLTPRNRSRKFLATKPEDVAQAIWKAARGHRDVIYVGPIWRPIMAIVRLVPEGVFKRLRF